MGMIDNSTKLATAQTVTTAGDTTSTNFYDFGNAASSDVGLQERLWVQAMVDTDAAGGATGLQAVLQHSDDNVTYTDLQSGQVTPTALLKTGAILAQMKLPLGVKRYFRITWRLIGGALTAGKFTAFVSIDVQRNIARPSGFAVK